MTNSKQTKKALFSSVIALILCFSMLIGTTFAWFTDSVQSGLNEIRAGNLDVELWHENSKTSDKVDGGTKLFTDVTLWEPGAVAYEILTVKNAGTLALKYAMSINWNKETENNLNGHKLSDILKVAVIENYGDLDMTDREAVVEAAEAATNGDLKTFADNGVLYPENNPDGNATEKTVCVVIYWVPGANDNDYNANNGQKTSDEKPLHIDLGVIVEATQLVYEGDSFGPEYDEKAEYPENQWLGDIDVSWYNETDTEFTLNTPAELAGLATIVNGTAEAPVAARSTGTTYIQDSFADKTIKLGDSMDLNNLPWTPIGGHGTYVDSKGNTRTCVFDGTFDGNGETIYNLNVDEDAYAGLFGAIQVGEVKNVTIYGATIRSNHYAGALVAWGYVDVDKCYVIGADVVCTPADEDYNGDKAGALVGWTGEGCSSITNCTVEKSTVSAYRDLGGLVGMAHNDCIVTGNTVDNVEVKYITTANYDASGNKNLGAVIGRFGTNVTNSGNKASVATAEQVKAAVANGVTAVIPQNVTIALELAEGETLSVANGNAIVNNGTLTISGGTVGSDSAYAISNKGSLTIDGATIANGVNNSGYMEVNSGVVNTTRGGGSHAVYHAGTMLIVNGGEFSGNGNEVIFVPNNSATTIINGGTFDKVENPSYLIRGGMRASVNGGVFYAYDENGADPSVHFVNVGSINGGTFNYAVKETALGPNCVVVDNGDGTWTVLPALESGATLSAVANYPGLYTDGTDYYVYDANGLISLRNFWKANSSGNNMWGKTYNIMADIDGTGYTWDNVWVNVGSNYNDGFVIDGNGHTINGLTLNGGMFSGTPNGADNTEPGVVKNLTFENVEVVGDHWTAVVWNQLYNELVLENVHVLNSKITGKCNVAALVGGTTIEGVGDAAVTFKNCSVKDTTITATGTYSGVEGDWSSDPTGASVYMSRAFGNTTVTFEDCASEGNTVTNGETLVGGGIYGYTAISNGWWAGTGVCYSFDNWNGTTVIEEGVTLKDALSGGTSGVALPAGDYDMVTTTGNVAISGTKDTVIKVSDVTANNVAFNGVTVASSGNAYTGIKHSDTVVYNDCVIQNVQYLYAENVVFNNCTFDFEATNDYVWTYGATNVEFNNCTFNTMGKAILVFQDGSANDCTVIVNGCTFNATAPAYNWDKTIHIAAVSIDGTQGGTYNVIIKDTKYLDEDFNGLWQDKTSAGNITVTVDGVTVLEPNA